MSIRNDIIAHWKSFKNPLINDILINLEKLEKDISPKLNTEEEAKVAKLLAFCEKLPADSADIYQLILVFNKLPAAYMLYMIHKLQNLNSDLIMQVISYAQKHKETDTEIANFFQRNMVFEKSQLLGRIFSNTRMKSLLGVL